MSLIALLRSRDGLERQVTIDKLLDEIRMPLAVDVIDVPSGTPNVIWTSSRIYRLTKVRRGVMTPWEVGPVTGGVYEEVECGCGGKRVVW